jgi:hypothetical protein
VPLAALADTADGGRQIRAMPAVGRAGGSNHDVCTGTGARCRWRRGHRTLDGAGALSQNALIDHALGPMRAQTSTSRDPVVMAERVCSRRLPASPRRDRRRLGDPG